MTLTVVRTALKDAVAAALNDENWLGTDKEPLTPDDPSFWVNSPNDARRTTLTAGLQYEIAVSFCVGLFDTDLAQEKLNDIYEPDLWAAIEAFDTDAYVQAHVVRLDEPYGKPYADGRVMWVVDMPIDIYT